MKRYDICPSGDNSITEQPEGGYVRFTEAEDLRAQLAEAKTETEAAIREMKDHNAASADVLEQLWKDIILSRSPHYGPWEYPGQAYRHIKAALAESERVSENRIRAYQAEMNSRATWEARAMLAEATLAERDRQLTYFLKVLRDIASDGGQSGGCLAERAEKALAALSAPAAEQPSLAEAELRAAWEAGAAHVIGSHRDFKQTHPAFAEWMASRHKPAAPAEKGEGK